MTREVNSGDELYGDGWYCRAADEAIERIWWASLKRTGTPRDHWVYEDKGEYVGQNAPGYRPVILHPDLLVESITITAWRGASKMKMCQTGTGRGKMVTRVARDLLSLSCTVSVSVRLTCPSVSVH
jgi:hypothetical protein